LAILFGEKETEQNNAMPLYVYFILTVLIELPIVLVLLKANKKELLLVGFLLNLFTWPLLHVFYATTNFNLNVMELAVALVEGWGYWLFFQQPLWKCLAIGFLVNGLSYGIGILIN
jgi:hypothetical protein